MKRSFHYPPSRVWLFLGQPGTGKTTRARRFVDELLADGRDLALIHDPHGEDAGGEGYEGKVWPSVAAFRAAPSLPGRRHVFREVDLPELTALAVEIGKRGQRVVLVIDELDMACLPGGRYVDNPPQRAGEPPQRGNLYRCIHYGRHIGVDLVGTARRTSNIGTDVGANAEAIYLFRLSGHRDLEWVREVCDDETREVVAALPRYHAVVFDKFNGMRREGASKEK